VGILSHRSDSLAAISFLLLVFGAAVFHISLYSLTWDHPLPLVALLAGILLQAFALAIFVGCLLNKGLVRQDSGFCLAFLAIFSLSMSMTRLSRFAGFSGFDFLREVQVMHYTARTGYWDPSLTSISNYQSSLAITVLPTVASGILDIPPDSAFLFQTFALMGLLPLAVQAVVSALTNSVRLGTLSGVLLATNWFFFGAHLIGKTAPALFLATIALYCLIRNEVGLNLAGALLGLGAAMSHYTVALVFSFTVLAVVISSFPIVPTLKRLRWLKELGTPTVNLAYSLLAIMLVVLWLSITTNVITAASTSAAQVFNSIVTLASGPKRVDTSLAVSNAAGPAVTVWFNFQNLLIGIGGLFWVNKYRKSAIRGGLASWLLAGLASICLLLAWILLPFLSVSVESTRILAIILPVVIGFSAVILFELFNRRNVAWKGLVLVIFVLMLPMNLMAANQTQNIFYHQLQTISISNRESLESISVPTDTNAAATIWISQYLPTHIPIEVDAVGRYAVLSSSPFPIQPQYREEGFPPYNFTGRPTLLSYYFVLYGNWTLANLGARATTQGDPQLFLSLNLENRTHNLVYSSPKFWIVIPNPR